MLPLSTPSSDHHHHPIKKPKISSPSPSPSPPSPSSSPLIPFSSISFLIISILFLQSLLFLLLSPHRPHLIIHSSSSFPPLPTITVPDIPVKTESLTSPLCDSGSIYVYDIPSEYNVLISGDCEKLNPWNSRCTALSNHGFGPRAETLTGIVPSKLIGSWYWTDQFATELIFHRRMLNHRCRTMDAGTATAFYVPFYAGLAVGRYLWADHQGSVQDRDRDCMAVMEWIRSRSVYYNKSEGWDHFVTMGRITWDFRRTRDNEWGSKCMYTKGMENVTRLLIERNPWDYFDVGIPYPTGFHPSTDADLRLWQEFVGSRNRTTLFCFAGATRGVIRNDFRGVLLGQCRDAGGACRVVDCAGNRCANGTAEVLDTFLDSRFCLQPRGDSFTRRSIFDCMVAGAIPVFFWRRTAYLQYEWFLPSEPDSYSVFIHRDKVKNGTSIKEVLEEIDGKKVKAMREKVIEYIPRLVYSKPEQGLETIKDAFDIAIDNVLKRMKSHKEKGYKFS